MFLDSHGERTVEEMGGMNVFFLRGDTFITPPLTGTLLAGITRDSILTLAPTLGIKVKEERIVWDDLLAGVKSGEISEAFACGTAAVITGIESFVLEDGSEVQVGDGRLRPGHAQALRRTAEHPVWRIEGPLRLGGQGVGALYPLEPNLVLLT